jgi:diguanylate cyclase (GGDEF)-like protein/PAS domain S-box-containing protein
MRAREALPQYATRIAALYFAAGMSWILITGELAARFISDAALAARVQQFAGAFFIAITAWAMYATIRRHGEELRHGEKRFRKLVEAAAQVVWMTDANGELLQVAESGKYYTDQSSQPFKDWRWQELVHPDDRDRVLTAWQYALASGENYHLEFRAQTRDGTWRFIEARAVPVPGKGSSIGEWIGIYTDITARKTAERLALEEAHRLRSILDGIHAYVGIVSPDGTLLYANEAAVRGIGVGRDAVLGLAFADTPWWKVSGELQQWLRTATATAAAGEPVRADVLHRFSNGELGWFDFSLTPIRDFSGRVMNLLAVGVDITQRRQLDEQLRSSEESLRLAVEGANVGLWDWNLQTDEITYSRVWKEQLGYAPDELVDKLDSFFRLLHPDDERRVLEHIEKYKRAPWDRYRIEYRLRHKNGGYRWIMSQASLSLDPAGRAERMIGANIDVTERRLAEEEAKRRARQHAQIDGLGISALSGMDFDEMMRRATKLICNVLQAEFAEILELKPDGMGLAVRAVHGIDAAQLNVPPREAGRGSFAGYVLLTSDVVVCNDRSAESRFRRESWLAELGVTSCIGAVIRGRSGEYGVVAAYARPTRQFSNDDINLLQSVALVITAAVDRRRSDERMLYLAHHDDLTGLPNRRYMRERLAELIDDASHSNQRVGLMFVDLDHFKVINDSLGHTAGDEMLKAIAGRMRGSLKEDDMLCRLGGDEFVIAIADASSPAQLARIAERVMETFARPVRIADQDVFTSATVGVSLYPDDARDVESLVRSADAALNRGKEQGRNRIEFFDAEIERRARHWFEVKSGLQHALERGELRVVYQPLVELSTGRIIGAEALLRWTSPLLGDVSPSVFVPIAEASGLIEPVGQFVLASACQQVCEWHRLGYTHLHVSVNLSASQFRHPNTVERMVSAVRSAGVDPHAIELEITEGVAMAEADVSAQTLEMLNYHGFRLSIDDFGTGYSSLNYLKRFYVDTLKIDRSFVRDVTTDNEDAAIARSIIALAHSLGIAVTAEGVETPAQLDFLRRCGCDIAQGFLFSPGLTANSFTELLTGSPWDVPAEA